MTTYTGRVSVQNNYFHIGGYSLGEYTFTLNQGDTYVFTQNLEDGNKGHALSIIDANGQPVAGLSYFINGNQVSEGIYKLYLTSAFYSFDSAQIRYTPTASSPDVIYFESSTSGVLGGYLKIESQETNVSPPDSGSDGDSAAPPPPPC